MLNQGIHGSEPRLWVHGQEEREEVIEGKLGRFVELAKDLIRSIGVHVVVAVPLDSEEERTRRGVPRMALRDRLVNASSILAAT